MYSTCIPEAARAQTNPRKVVVSFPVSYQSYHSPRKVLRCVSVCWQRHVIADSERSWSIGLLHQTTIPPTRCTEDPLHNTMSPVAQLIFLLAGG